MDKRKRSLLPCEGTSSYYDTIRKSSVQEESDENYAHAFSPFTRSPNKTN